MRTKKILIVDFDQNSLATLQAIFAKHGYQVVTASDGQSAWDKYNKEAPDLVLLEAMLPKIHGFELCQRITSERNSQTTVFIMTGVYKDRVYRTEALRTYGASGYFEKPLKMDELMASVEAVLGRPEVKPEPSKPKPVPVTPPRRVQKPREPDDDLFHLPEDLDRLSREIPKVSVPAAVPRHAASVSTEPAGEAIADELLKSVIEAESEPPARPKPKPVPDDSANGNGHEAIDIDKILKEALADFDFTTGKPRTPKPAPAPPPPPSAPPKPKIESPAAPAKPEATAPRPMPFVVPEKPKPTAVPVPPPVQKVKPATPPPPPQRPAPPLAVKPAAAPHPAPTPTIIPGDPGSDTSPFATVERPKPERPRETPRPAVAPAAPKPPEPIRFQTPLSTPYTPPSTPKPAWAAEPKDETEVLGRAAAEMPTAARSVEVPSPPFKPLDVTQKPLPSLFSDVSEPEPRKGFPVLAAVGAGVVVLAVAGYLILKPKKPASVPSVAVKPPAAVVDQTPATGTVEEPPPQPIEKKPEPKPKTSAPKPKVETQTRVADIGPSVEEALIVPTAPAAAALTSASGETASGAVQPPPTTEPPAGQVQTEPPAQGSVAAAGGAEAKEPASSAAPAKEGDLVDLATVDEQPRAIKTVEPVYPQSAQRLGVEGSITVNALIDENGNVIDTGILKGLKDDMGLMKAAEAAVRKWKFQPARKDGVNVKVWKPFVVVFKAQRKTS